MKFSPKRDDFITTPKTMKKCSLLLFTIKTETRRVLVHFLQTYRCEIDSVNEFIIKLVNTHTADQSE